MINVFITGPSGSLAKTIQEKYSSKIRFNTNRNSLLNELHNFLTSLNRSRGFILHFAAETNVDLCEKDKLHAINSNYVLTKEIVDRVIDYPNVTLVFISSASIFNGRHQKFYSENDKSNPINFYGVTKFLSEEYIKKEMTKYYIFRFGWLVGNPFVDKKFIGIIFHKLKAGENKLFGVNDQFGSVTFAAQFAEDLSSIFQQNLDYGTYNYCTDSVITRYDFLKSLINYYDFLDKVEIVPVSIINFKPKLIAERPKYELLSNRKAIESGLLKESRFDLMFEKFLKKYKDFF